MLKADENWDDYHYVRFTFQGGEGMAFRCPRKLGRLDWAESLESLRESKGLGPDALELDYESFQERLDQHRAPVKNLLLNQSILAGIGNWVADDALHLAGLHPAAPWQALDNEDRRRLFESLQKVLHIAIQSDADYARMPEEFLIHQRHKNGVSPRTGKPLEKMQVGGRSTYLCADTQPMPKEA
jgi:formamidopyrimidine-DNA glycosylase